MRKFFGFFILAAFLAGSVMPAMAQDDKSVAISGWVTMTTNWNLKDEEYIDATSGAALGGFATTVTPAPAGFFPKALQDSTDLAWALSGPTSFLDFRLKQGPVSGHVRMRWSASESPSGTIAHLYGTWDFGMGQLIVGNAPLPNNKEAGLPMYFPADRYGSMSWQSRGESLQLKFPVGPGTLWFAGINPQTAAQPWSNPIPATSTFDNKVVLPKIEVAYDFKVSNFNLYFVGGYQTYNQKNLQTDNDNDVTSYFIGFYGSWAMGPFSVNANAFYMRNPVEYAAVAPRGYGRNKLGMVGDASNDNDYTTDYSGFHVAAAYRLSDRVAFSGGYGWNKWERDNPAFGTVAAADISDEQQTYYVGAAITLYRNVIMYIPIRVTDLKDYEDTRATNALGTTGLTIDEGKETRVGFRWRIRF